MNETTHADVDYSQFQLLGPDTVREIAELTKKLVKELNELRDPEFETTASDTGRKVSS